MIMANLELIKIGLYPWSGGWAAIAITKGLEKKILWFLEENTKISQF